MTTDSSFAWSPTQEQRETSRLKHFLTAVGAPTIDALHTRTREDLSWFWRAALDDINIDWTTQPNAMYDSSDGMPWTRWWPGGHLNAATNAVDRHVLSRGNHPALIWEGDEGVHRTLTYTELSREVARAAGALRALGVVPGDAVGLCMPMIPETVVLFLACAKIGALIAPLFSGYGEGAITSRLNDCRAKVLCIADGFPRRGKPVFMKPIADEVVRNVSSMEHVVVVHRLDTADVTMRPGRDHWYHELIADMPDEATTHDTDANDPFMLIYTSGTTGKPKGTVHVHGGFPIKATQDMAHCFDVQNGDRLLWFTDIGWMMGPWAILGTLTLGATLVLFDGVPDYPAADRLWSVVERHRVSVLGVAPTVIRSLMQHGSDPVRSHDLSSLRILGSSGEPWNTEPWLWFLHEVGGGRCPIINYSGGTEVSGGIVASNILTPANPGSFSGPAPGMTADVYGTDGKPLRGAVGELVVCAPWPGMTQGFWHDRDRYLETYWSRWPDTWVHGDWAEIDRDGLWYIRGRSDDTIKVAGKRIGPAEVESALVAHPAVAEAAAIGTPDPIKGEALVVFVVLNSGVQDSTELRSELSQCVVAMLGKALKPHAVEIVSELPKTRNAKVLRRVVRAVYLGLDPGDLSALENRSAVEAMALLREKHVRP